MYFTYDTYINLFNFNITEPVTALTDLLLSASCMYFALNISKTKAPNANYWIAFFTLFTFCFFFGVIKHGSKAYLSNDSLLHIWLFYQMLSALALFFAQCAAASYYFTIDLFRKIRWVFGVQCIVAILSVLHYENFNAVIINQIIGFLFILILYSIRFKNGEKHAAYMLTSIAISMVAAVISVAKISISPWFNYNDIAHTFLFFSLFYMYKAAMGDAYNTANVNAEINSKSFYENK